MEDARSFRASGLEAAIGKTSLSHGPPADKEESRKGSAGKLWRKMAEWQAACACDGKH